MHDAWQCERCLWDVTLPSCANKWLCKGSQKDGWRCVWIRRKKIILSHTSVALESMHAREVFFTLALRMLFFRVNFEWSTSRVKREVG
jgi:hypothetical protein